tara:strand:+ start:152 stop:757 length:606 start_codon:yes stop_codon:yes gene_type:complete
LAYIGNKPANKAIVASDLDPAVITGQTALATSPADTDEFLISDAGTLKRLDASLIGGTNTPAFEATLSSNFTFSSASDTKVPFATETFDTDGAYDHSTNYRFTPQTAGKYHIYLWLRHNPSSTNNIVKGYTYIKKNGSYAASFYMDTQNQANVMSVGGSRVIEFNGSSDYVEAFVHQETGGTPQIDQGTYTFFGGYKLIGV